MKKIKYLLIVVLTFLVVGLFSSKTIKEIKADEEQVDWMPFNYVLTDGFGSATKYLDIRTDVSITDGKITASGRTTKGGMGLLYLKDLDINNLSFNVSINSWQQVSPDRWFGMTLMDKGIVEDDYNEVPFSAKHSESWSNDYGAGIIFGFRPNGEGTMQVQFNFVGINSTYDADMLVQANAGEYNDGYLGWGGWLSTIQLCNTDWTNKTDYDNITITMKEMKEAETSTGYKFDINNGYWKRTDAIDWDNLASDVFTMLDKDNNGTLSQEEKDNYIYGPAYETSVIPYLNWGESMFALTKFKRIVETKGEKLYFRFMYKDTWDIRDGVDDASFTINSIGNNPATTMTSFSKTQPKTFTGKLSGTLTTENLHAGVYPEMIESFAMVDALEKDYKKAKTNIESATAGKEYKVFNVKGSLGNNKYASIISNTQVTFDLSDYKDAELYKIVGEDVDKIDSLENVRVSSSNVNYLLVYAKGSENSNGSNTKEKGCKSALSLLSLVAIIPLPCIMFYKKKEE